MRDDTHEIFPTPILHYIIMKLILMKILPTEQLNGGRQHVQQN